MKLSLNVPTLERLIGGDTEVELELRQAAASEFAKRHLKSLINDETTKEIRRIEQIIQTEVGVICKRELSALTNTDSWSGRISLREDFKTLIKIQLQSIISLVINEAVSQATHSMDFNKIVKEQLDNQTVFYAKEAARNEIKKLLEIK